MKRLLTVFMLLILPLHLSWAVATSYCQHESNQTVHHFGHHTHPHQGSADDNNDAEKSPLSVHGDCGICHLSCVAAAVSAQSVSVMAPGSFEGADPPEALPSTVPEAPERPNWVPVA